MKMKMFDPVIYPAKLWVYIDRSPKYLADNFLQFPSGKEINIVSFERFEALVFSVSNNKSREIGIAVWFVNRNVMSMKLIAHESVHIANRFWSHMEEEDYGEEANAYLVGWIADCIWKTKINMPE